MGRSDWDRFSEGALRVDGLEFLLDTSTMPGDGAEDAALAAAFERAFDEMEALERGAIANPDEGRRVGHYWLRAPDLAPETALRDAIVDTRERVKAFAEAVIEGEVRPHREKTFRRVLLIGIGGSALGPQLAFDALDCGTSPLCFSFMDNTDPEGFARTFNRIGAQLGETLVVVTSKSGGTPETRNGFEEVHARLVSGGYDAPRHLVAVTGETSALARRARDEGWLAVFPMWDWVGGRTSETSAVGLLPLALSGRDVHELLDGARIMDEATRLRDVRANPAARLASAWYSAAEGRGARDMVVIPYRDHLSLLARYLQQLVMESLGKREDLSGRVVRQGLTVYGNKGSTDQHAYVQQLRDGVDNYFLTLIGVLEEPPAPPLEIEPGTTSGDYLLGFLLGTRRALVEDSRRVMSLMLPRVDERALGGLIALFERAVGLYASLVGINAYHQPGVEAGKKAAARVLELQRALVASMVADAGTLRTAPDWAERAGHAELAVEAFWVLEHLAHSPRRGVRREGAPLDPAARYGV